VQKIVVIGGSAGAIDALMRILSSINPAFAYPIVCVLHVMPGRPSLLAEIFSTRCNLAAKEAESTERVERGTVYFGPPDYHLSLEADGTFSLSTEDPVNYSRPSIDVLFESASYAFGANVVAILLSGANSDGAQGLATILKRGGRVIVQDPLTAAFPEMPQAAIERVKPTSVLAPEGIAEFLNSVF
jgi:two-component system chemotaxis response regulator CheB